MSFFWKKISINKILRKVQICHFRPTLANKLNQKAYNGLFVTKKHLKRYQLGLLIVPFIILGSVGAYLVKKWSLTIRTAQKLCFWVPNWWKSEFIKPKNLSKQCKNALELRYLHVNVEPKTPSLCPGVDQKIFFFEILI